MSKVKTTVATKTMKDQDLIEMFNQMIGQGRPDPNIVIPKYDQLMQMSKDYVNLLVKFVQSPVGKFPPFKAPVMQIVDFIKRTQAELSGLQIPQKEDKLLAGKSLDEINRSPELMARLMQDVTEKYDIEQLGVVYPELKDCNTIKEIIMTCKNINRLLREEMERTNTETDCLADSKNLSEKFITKADGVCIEIFNFSSFNFKDLFIRTDVDDKVRSYVLLFLRLIYTKSREIVKMISSPDIDVEKFSEVLVKSIKDIRKHIPRCDKAFDKIEESVNLLQNNFGGYYKDFIESQNPGIIIENFVLDVAQDSQADLQTTMQFKEIIKFYKAKMQKHNVKDPKVQKLFQMLGANLDVLEEKTRGGKRKTDGESDTPKPPAEPITEERREEINKSFLPESPTTAKKTKARKPRKKK